MIRKALHHVAKRFPLPAEDDDTMRTYYFVAPVNDRSVKECVSTLDKWAKDSPAPIEIVLRSDGGRIDSGLWFVEEVRHIANSHDVFTRAAGLTASMAGVMLQAGTERVIGHESRLHLHPPSASVWDSVHVIGEVYDRLMEQYEQIIGIYASRSKLTADQIRAEVDARADWYLSSQEALDAGFVDAIF